MAEDSTDYKDTLFLPKTNFPMRAGLPRREPEWLAHWDDIKVYEELRKKADGRKRFVLHDGPPYANGNLHIGHALNKILKDFITRSQQMLGKESLYVPGWDCHGLPIEWKIEEKYRASGKSKDDVPTLELRRECRQFAEKWVEIQKKEFKRLGIIGDWDNPYLTMDYSAEAVIAEEFMKFVGNGALYQGSKPVMWSPVEKTALAEAEIEYHEHQSPTIWVKFSVAEGKLKGTSIVIWTTTPWTIPSNKAVAYGNTIDYAIYKVDETEDESWVQKGELLIFAEKLADECLVQSRVKSYSKVASVSSADLKNTVLEHPFSNTPGSNSFWNYEVPMISGEFVTDETGSGFVHTAPSHGADDYEAFVSLGWLDKMTHNINEDSSFSTNVPFFSGLQVFDKKGKAGKANNAVIDKLIQTKSLIARGRLQHSYPHSWRSKAPIIFRNTPQWFVSVDSFLNDNLDKFGRTIRERSLASIDRLVEWTPVSGRNRLHSMIASRPDWVLSRQRAWGVPLTCFVKKGADPSEDDFILKDKAVNEKIITAFKKEGADCWFAGGAKERFLLGRHNPEEYEQIFDILDVWFDSGSSHAFVLRDREDGKWPADLYLEGTDQHRGWFHSSMLQSCGTRGRAPYNGVLTHGFALDEKGMKMSKSSGNTVSPEQVIKQYGADILRLWVAQSDYGSDLRIGPEILKGVADSYRRLRNTMRFLLGSLDDFNPTKEKVEIEQMPELERWILHRLTELDQIIRDGYNSYSFQSVFQHIFHFCTVDLSSIYFDIRKDSLYCDHSSSLTRRSSRTVLDILYYRLVTWLAPILVFTTEEVWLERFSKPYGSVHLLDIPETRKDWVDNELGQKWEQIRKVRKVVTGAIEIQRQNKVIGSSLEAAPRLFVKDAELRKKLRSVDFSEICITSSIEHSDQIDLSKAFSLPEIEGVFVEFDLAEGKKCQRCWRFSVSLLPHKGVSSVCSRCKAVLDSMD